MKEEIKPVHIDIDIEKYVIKVVVIVALQGKIVGFPTGLKHNLLRHVSLYIKLRISTAGHPTDNLSIDSTFYASVNPPHPSFTNVAVTQQYFGSSSYQGRVRVRGVRDSCQGQNLSQCQKKKNNNQDKYFNAF